MKQIKNFLRLSAGKKKAILSVFLGEKEYKKLKQAEGAENDSEAWSIKGEDKPIAWFSENEFIFLEEAMREGVFQFASRYRGFPSLSNDKFKGTIHKEKFNILLENIKNNLWIRDFFVLSTDEQQNLLFALLGERGKEEKPKKMGDFLYGGDSRLATFHEDEVFLNKEQAGGLFSWEKIPNPEGTVGSPTPKSFGSLMSHSEFLEYSAYSFEQRFYMKISIENFNRMLEAFKAFK
ncbi:MAG: hypothetical protein LBO09_08805 [Candidatus Peribacteria bacterium]|jgi:hypothetical protein|nr:hypothetical protein [Candidatus Peribacteria bacterium]